MGMQLKRSGLMPYLHFREVLGPLLSAKVGDSFVCVSCLQSPIRASRSSPSSPSFFSSCSAGGHGCTSEDAAAVAPQPSSVEAVGPHSAVTGGSARVAALSAGAAALTTQQDAADVKPGGGRSFNVEVVGGPRPGGALRVGADDDREASRLLCCGGADTLPRRGFWFLGRGFRRGVWEGRALSSHEDRRRMTVYPAASAVFWPAGALALSSVEAVLDRRCLDLSRLTFCC